MDTMITLDYKLERERFDKWFYGKGISSPITKEYMWSTWLAAKFEAARDRYGEQHVEQGGTL
jgi:hypothetical protein